jgi:RHS repeat-associated protein
MNPTGYAQIVEELVPDGGGGWQVARSSTIGLDVISTSAASGDRGLLHSYDSDAPMAMLYDAGGSVRALFSPEPGAGSFSPAFVELDDDPNRIDDDDAAVRVQVFDYDAFGQLLRVTAGIGGPSNGPPAIDPGGVPAWRFAANTPNSEFAAAHANFSLSTLLYRGEQYDAHLRMQYLRARHYDMGTGRFARVDDAPGVRMSPQTYNTYAYANGDPVQMMDPAGLFATSQAELMTNIATMMRVASTVLRTVRTIKTAVDNIRLGFNLLSLLGGNGQAFLNDVKNRLQSYSSGWQQNALPHWRTLYLFRADFWQHAADVLVRHSGDILMRIVNEQGRHIWQEYRGIDAKRFRWVIYMPTPAENQLLNPGRSVRMPGLRLADRQFQIQFGNPHAKYLGRLFGLGFQNRTSRYQTQFFRMDYHGHHEHGWNVRGARYDFNFHVGRFTEDM